jgi:hypothetical protein
VFRVTDYRNVAGTCHHRLAHELGGEANAEGAGCGMARVLFQPAGKPLPPASCCAVDQAWRRVSEKASSTAA